MKMALALSDLKKKADAAQAELKAAKKRADERKKAAALAFEKVAAELNILDGPLPTEITAVFRDGRLDHFFYGVTKARVRGGVTKRDVKRGERDQFVECERRALK